MTRYGDQDELRLEAGLLGRWGEEEEEGGRREGERVVNKTKQPPRLPEVTILH